MHRGIGWLLGVAVAVLAAPATALAANLCVPNNLIPACHGSGANEGTIGQAVTNGNSGDTVLIGAGSYNETVNDSGKHLTFIGAGAGQTVIHGQGIVAMAISANSSVSNLTVDLAAGTGNAGLSLAGSSDHVAITATNPANTKDNIGVVLNGGTFTHGTITLPLTGTDAPGYAGVVGQGTITDSVIQALVGAAPDPTVHFPTLRRDTIVANQGVLVGVAPVALDDLLIRTVSGSSPELGLGMSGFDMSATVTGRHLTIVGSGSAGSDGVQAIAVGITNPTTTNFNLASSIVRGYARSIAANELGGPFTATATVTLDHSFYDPATAQASATGPPSVSRHDHA
jgi:hypothetical protein